MLKIFLIKKKSTKTLVKDITHQKKSTKTLVKDISIKPDLLFCHNVFCEFKSQPYIYPFCECINNAIKHQTELIIYYRFKIIHI